MWSSLFVGKLENYARQLDTPGPINFASLYNPKRSLATLFCDEDCTQLRVGDCQFARLSTSVQHKPDYGSRIAPRYLSRHEFVSESIPQTRIALFLQAATALSCHRVVCGENLLWTRNMSFDSENNTFSPVNRGGRA